MVDDSGLRAPVTSPTTEPHGTANLPLAAMAGGGRQVSPTDLDQEYELARALKAVSIYNPSHRRPSLPRGGALSHQAARRLDMPSGFLEETTSGPSGAGLLGTCGSLRVLSRGEHTAPNLGFGFWAGFPVARRDDAEIVP